MIRLDIHVDKKSRKLLQVVENNDESWLIFNRHFPFVIFPFVEQGFCFSCSWSISPMRHVQLNNYSIAIFRSLFFRSLSKDFVFLVPGPFLP